MTAKFTTDPTAVLARRLRSFQGRVGMYPFQVGCGYAAVQGNLYDLWIVRLCDSVAWHVTGPGGADAAAARLAPDRAAALVTAHVAEDRSLTTTTIEHWARLSRRRLWASPRILGRRASRGRWAR